MTIFWTVGFYLVLTYMPTFTQKYAGLTKAQSLWANTIGLFIIVAAIPVAGMLSDRIGRKPLLLVSAISFLVLSYPMLQFTLGQTAFWAIVGVQASFAVMLAIFSGPGPAAIAEIFPTRGRATWMSSAYSLAVAIFGGFAPFIATWLIEQTGTPLAPAFYLMVAAAVSSIVILTIRETAHLDLD
jgi:MHS family proline/betaine transporter-like MFS transporter